MRIAVVGGYAPSLIIFRRELLEALSAAGHEVVACASEDDQEVKAELAKLGVAYRAIRLSRTGANPFDDIRTLRRFYKTWRHLQPDLVLAYTIKPIVYGLLAARLAGVQRRFAMVTGLGTGLAEANGLKGRLRKSLAMFLYKRGLHGAEAVLFQNRDNQSYFAANGMVQPNQRQVLIDGSGVNLQRFSHHEPDVSKPTFLMVARLLIDKGIREYVEAARKVKAGFPEARFLLVGPTDRNPMALPMTELEAWKKEGVIEYLGSTSDVRPHLRNCSIYVLPSYHEGLPRSTLEAMAVGRAVITTDVPGCRETVQHGENGLMVPVRDPDALAEAMVSLVQQPELVRRMGKASLRMVEQRFDVHKVNGKILAAMGIDVEEQQSLIIPAYQVAATEQIVRGHLTESIEGSS